MLSWGGKVQATLSVNNLSGIKTFEEVVDPVCVPRGDFSWG